MECGTEGRFRGQLAPNAHWSNPSRLKAACALLLGALFVLAAPSFCANTPRSAKVLVLWFGDKDSPALAEFENGLRTTMERGTDAPVWIYDESFDQGWLGQGSPYAQTMERFLNDKYASRGIDIVVTIGNYPLQYMQRRRKTLLPGAKLMYFSWQSPQQRVPDTTGLVWSSDLAPTLEVALTQNPGTHHVLLIAGATAPDRGMAQFFLATGRKYLQEKHKDVDIQVLPAGTLNETISTLAALPKDTIAVLTTYYGDSAGQGFVPVRILPVLSAATNRPIYGWADTFLGHGIVGGSLINIEASGAAFGNMALRVVRGERPGTIPEQRANFQQNAFDARELKRWGIGMDKVPADSIVINREYTFWELYKWRIVGLLALIVIEAALIAKLVGLVFAQKRNLKHIEYRRQLETLVAKLAAAFVNLPGDLLDAEIQRSFERLLDYFNLDRISLFEFAPGTSQLRLLCARAMPDVEQPPAIVDLHHLPWIASQVLGDTPIAISRLGDLPEEAGTLREVLFAHGIRSFLTFPLRHNRETFATLSFSTVRNEREWEPDLVRALRTVADLLGGALERKYAENVASESRKRLGSIIESAMDAIIAVDSQQHIVVFNATAEKMFGCPAAEALGQPVERFIPHRLRDQHHEHVLHFSGSGTTSRNMGALGSLWALRANGEEFPIEASISHATTAGDNLFTVIIRDVTERNRTMQQLRDSSQLNASILESLRNHVAVLDSNGTIVAATTPGPEFKALTGINLLDLRVGANYFETCKAAVEAGDPDVAAAVAGVQAVRSGSQKYFELEYDSMSGTDRRWFSMSVTPLRSTSGGVVISHEDITERKRHEQAIQELSGRLINAQEQERSRIARELHDDINQQVAMLAIELQQLQDFFSEDSTDGRQKTQALWKKAHALSVDIQHLSHQLHSTKLEHLGIVAALRGLCNEFSEQHKIETSLQVKQVPAQIGSDVALSLFRVAQESLHNVAKHSHARKVRVELVGTNDDVVLRVSDDGDGFNPDEPRYSSGLGMISMSERVRLVGGILLVSSKQALGTQVEALIPLPRQKAAEDRSSRFASEGRKVG